MPLLATTALILAIMQILPGFSSLIICLATACAVTNAPLTLIPSMLSTSSGVYSSAGVS